ncbi:MAG: GumC family protein [Rhabdaerophilum sp.]
MTRKSAPSSRIRRFQRSDNQPINQAEATLEPVPADAIPREAAPDFTSHQRSGSRPRGEADAPIGLSEFGDILRRRWKTIAATTAIVTTLGVAFAFLAKPQFLATTSIFVDPRNRASFQIEGTGTGGGYDPNLVDSQIVLIESNTVLRRVVAAEKLLNDAEFTKGPGNAEFNVMRNLKEAVKVKRPDRTYVVEVQVRTQSGEKSARIANAIVAAYLSDGRDSKSETADREQTWLDRHLKNLQDRLKDAEARVEAYKVENKILGVGSEGLLVGEQQLSELNRGIVEAQRRAAEAKSVMDQVDQLRRSGKMPDATNDALKSGVIERLRTQLSEVLRLEANARSTLGPLHPAAAEIREQVSETRRQINEELNRIAEGARSAFSVARANVMALERQLDGLKRDANSTNQTLLRLRELERAVEAQKTVYEKFLRDKEQIARLTVDTPAGRVIAPAIIPQTRSFPNRPLIAALAFVGGLFAGVGLALALETLSRARGGHRPVTPNGWGGLMRPGGGAPSPTGPAAPLASAMLPTRATQPYRFSPGNRLANSNSVASRPSGNAAYGQEVRQLAHDIGTHLAHGPAPTLLISGLTAGNGQPELTGQLGQSLADLGWKVLLIDGTGGRNGLSTLLATKGPVKIQVGNRSDFALEITDGLFLVPFGGVPKRVRQKQMPDVGDCDIVLIDGPAVGTAALERLDLDHRVDGVIAVLPEGPDSVSAAMDMLDRRFGSALMGVVRRAA